MRLVPDFAVTIQNQPVPVAGDQSADHAVVEPFGENVRAKTAAVAPPPGRIEDEQVETVEHQADGPAAAGLDVEPRKRVRVAPFAHDGVNR